MSQFSQPLPLMPQSTHQLPLSNSTHPLLLMSQSINPLPLESQTNYQQPLLAHSTHPPSLACQAAANPTSSHTTHGGSSYIRSQSLRTEQVQELAMLIKLEKWKDCNLAVKIFKRITTDSERSDFDAKSAIGIEILNDVRAFYYSIFPNNPWSEALTEVKTSLRGGTRSKKRSHIGN